jgi:HlyD family secretion protein
MKTWLKVVIAIVVLSVLGGIVWYSVYQTNKGVVTVQTGHVAKADLTSIVTASGEVRPKNYTNVLGEGIGKITEIVVKREEGRHPASAREHSAGSGRSGPEGSNRGF